MKKNRFLLSMVAVAAILSGCSKSDMLADEPQPQTGTKSEFSGDFTPSRLNDSLALVALYDALGGENWTFTYWKRTPIRFWEGVTLADVNGEMRVVKLLLAGAQLKGELPREIAMLTELKSLRISDSDFLTGKIIDEVYSLTKLEMLNFRFTRLTGELSPLIGQLTELDSLDLWRSQFGSNVVGEDGYIDVNMNPNTVFFSGSLPREIGKLTKLEYLNLARCGFTGELPEELGNLTSAIWIDLTESRYTGSIPASLGKLKNLTSLMLADNQLTGNIPEELCEAESLETLIVSDNQLSGPIPSNIGHLSRLSYFDVSNNQLTGAIPQSIEDNGRLGIFYAQNNQLSGNIPSELGRRHPMLCFVRLSNNQLTGSLPDIVGYDLGGVAGIYCASFYVDNNRLTGQVPDLWMRYNYELVSQLMLPQQPGYGFDNLK